MGLLDENTRCRISTKVEQCLEYRTFPEVLTKSMTETLHRGQNRLLEGPERNTSLKLRIRTRIQEGLLSANMEGVAAVLLSSLQNPERPTTATRSKGIRANFASCPFSPQQISETLDSLPQLSACYILHPLGTRKSGSDADKTTPAYFSRTPPLRPFSFYSFFPFAMDAAAEGERARKGRKRPTSCRSQGRERGTTEPQRGNTTCNRPRRRGRPPLSPPSLPLSLATLECSLFSRFTVSQFFLPTANKHASRKLPFE